MLFHQREVAVCGYSGSGKTTLITRLIDRLSARHTVGYVKHDAHHFDMDTAGKDTWQARHHGARTVFINDANHWAVVANGIPPAAAVQAMFAPLDMVIVEGYKFSLLPKLVMIDKEEKILETLRGQPVGLITAYAGPESLVRGLDAPYFQRDDVDGITGHISALLGLQGA